MQALPKISCLTVTLNRLILLKQAIRCYCDQTYPNRELVIVSEGAPRYRQAIADHVGRLGRDDIRLVFLDGDDYTLGQVRNVSLDAAQGEIICQWDDDDLYHPERLRVQAERLFAEGAAACFMTDQLQFFVEERELFWNDWTQHSEDVGKREHIPGTVMMYKEARFRYPEAGPDARTGEDNVFREALFEELNVASLQGAGFLYVYRYHGSNTLSVTHHRGVNEFGCCKEAFFRQREQALRAALPYYRLPVPCASWSATGTSILSTTVEAGCFGNRTHNAS